MYVDICDCCNEQTYRCEFCNGDELVFSIAANDYRCMDCGKLSDEIKGGK